MSTTLQVANYIIAYSERKNYDRSFMKLLKILYFCQEQYYTLYHDCLFSDQLKFASFGPYSDFVWKEYHHWGNNDILVYDTDIGNLNQNQKDVIEQVTDWCSKYSNIEILHQIWKIEGTDYVSSDL